MRSPLRCALLRILTVCVPFCLLAAVGLGQTTLSPATKEVGAGLVPYQILVGTTGDWTASADAAWSASALARSISSAEKCRS